MPARRFDLPSFQRAVERRWKYLTPGRLCEWTVSETEDGCDIEVAPVFQEVFGSKHDGMLVWAPFRFDLSEFQYERELWVETLVVASYNAVPEKRPYLGVAGTYGGVPFTLTMHLEPTPGASPAEFVDQLRGEVRPTNRRMDDGG